MGWQRHRTIQDADGDKHRQISHGLAGRSRWKETTPTTSHESLGDTWLDGPNKNRLGLQEEEHIIAAGEADDGRGGMPPIPENKVSRFGFLLQALPVWWYDSASVRLLCGLTIHTY